MTTTALPTTAPLVGAYLPEILSLARRGLLWAVLYGVFTRAGAGGCLESAASDGARDPVCSSATLEPSPVVWLAMAVVFVVSVGRAAKAPDTPTITRVLSRAATAMWVLPLAACVLGIWTFATGSPEAWVHGTPPPHVVVRITPE